DQGGSGRGLRPRRFQRRAREAGGRPGLRGRASGDHGSDGPLHFAVPQARVAGDHARRDGLAAATVAGCWRSSQVFGIRPLDPPTYVAVLGLLLAAVALAAYLPARRAARLDPAATLRAE